MQTTLKLFSIFLFTTFGSSLAFADYNSQCLSDCFASGHDCQYCQYECYTNGYSRPEINYTETPCYLNRFQREE